MNLQMTAKEMAPYGSQKIIENFVDRNLISRTERHNKIKKAYGVHEMFQRLPIDERCDVYFQSLRLNADKIAQIYGASIGSGVALGAVVGGIVGLMTANPFGALACGGMGCGVGAGVGLSVGTSVCCINGYWYQDSAVEFGVKNSRHYQEFLDDIVGEHYNIFLQFLDDYIDSLDSLDEIENYVCVITGMIPKDPVFSKYDILRQHVFEKVAIEQYLDLVEEKLADAIANGASEQALSEIRSVADPFRGPYFQKCDLVYDVSYSKKVISLLRSIQKSFPGSSNAYADPKISTSIAALSYHYASLYALSTRATVDYLMRDLLALGVSPAKVLDMGREFDRHFDEMDEYGHVHDMEFKGSPSLGLIKSVFEKKT